MKITAKATLFDSKSKFTLVKNEPGEVVRIDVVKRVVQIRNTQDNILTVPLDIFEKYTALPRYKDHNHLEYVKNGIENGSLSIKDALTYLNQIDI